MQSKVKLSKRQIKEDKFTAFVLTSKQRVAENWQFLVIGGVVLVLAVVAVVYFASSRTSREAEGSRLFAQGMAEYRNGNRQVALTTLQEVVDEHGGHETADNATYLLGQIQFELRNFAEAIRWWEQYLAKYRDNRTDRAAALAGIAAANEEQGNNAAAAQKYREAAAEYPEGPLAWDYHTGAMRNYLAAGQVDKAREELDSLRDKYAGTEIYNRAARLFAAQAVPAKTAP
ncbi:MAG TPA: tetratricopeptide repeat protein [candidate division Zixibacteria bacterium]|nr:tetratricopeptide repeat protein [candidate division Zixibacteria bacterium]MDD4918468.1 tetratricopeptide repeat protein [candidate division Zixibacteria bacterium]MDM7971795.1 tetratricopeptide repeat protein [candidate division Zixibacteria bacterium]HOD66701.1 tetratricopeptide repeat protein [candidate division Zixibacteria bacterium]HPM37189.1 tetratricopeptide repeat protein [candidate division Zixibacteria bacterium]